MNQGRLDGMAEAYDRDCASEFEPILTLPRAGETTPREARQASLALLADWGEGLEMLEAHMGTDPRFAATRRAEGPRRRAWLLRATRGPKTGRRHRAGRAIPGTRAGAGRGV